jgi:hypothetical protein
MANPESTLAEIADPRPDPDDLDSLDVYDPVGERVDPPRMFYVVTTTGPQEWLEGEHILTSAGGAWNNPGTGFKMWIPDETESLFVDSGGFQSTVHWGGEFPYSATDLFEWAEEIGADYVAGMDLACERAEDLANIYDDLEADEIDTISERVEKTIDNQLLQNRVYREGDWSFEFVPVVQGYQPSDYRYCARRLRNANVANDYMAIGSVCKRDSIDDIWKVLRAMKDELPHTEWHLFGATRNVWKATQFWGQFASGDTHAWAKNKPGGGFTQNKEDKRRAFHAFKADMEETVDKIRATDPISADNSSRNHLAELIFAGGGAVECVCGTEIPAYGTDFEPSCRHCERKKVNRWDQQQHLVETAEEPDNQRGHEASSLTDF